MKIAISGKGGVGKTTITSTLAYILSRDHEVYIIDADSDMNLATSLGIKNDVIPIAKMKDLIKERTGADPDQSFGEVFKMNPKIKDLPEKLSIDVKGNGTLKLMVMGTVEKGGEGCICPASVMLKAIMRNIVVKKEEIVILDMEAGIEHFGRKTAESVDTMIIIVEPGLKSIETAGRIKKLGKDIGIVNIIAILNKCFSKEDKEFIEEELKKMNINLIGIIPFDNNVMKSDIEGKPLINYIDSPALKSIEKIAKTIEKELS
ncbi:ATP-binding protein [Methanobrevibacter filiformis]|uniref:Septum site-determining protein MinD n=1 Tax=Methanobrevibacter filiformis TaxID=55758 RepID=A0A166ESN1_9EURY|nr:P-loop NTPase [Methanobrevibacter filiformis]KZX16965.1 septum site-determining protein MinD [Methanobrevibacter filiformis]